MLPHVWAALLLANCGQTAATMLSDGMPIPARSRARTGCCLVCAALAPPVDTSCPLCVPDSLPLPWLPADAQQVLAECFLSTLQKYLKVNSSACPEVSAWPACNQALVRNLTRPCCPHLHSHAHLLAPPAQHVFSLHQLSTLQISFHIPTCPQGLMADLRAYCITDVSASMERTRWAAHCLV